MTSTTISYSRRCALRAHQQYAEVLNSEWQHLAHQPANLTRADRWAVTSTTVTSLDDVLVWIGFQSPGAPITVDDHDANERLARLIGVARDGDQLAGRVVLQRILPGLRARARRWADGCAPAGIAGRDVLTELVAAAWDTIVNYPVERRSRHIAANLIADTVGRVLVAPTRRRSAGEQVCDPEQFTGHAQPHEPVSASELASVLLDARRAGVDRHHIELFCDLWQADGSTAAVATTRGVTARTIRTQRATAADRIRTAVA